MNSRGIHKNSLKPRNSISLRTPSNRSLPPISIIHSAGTRIRSQGGEEKYNAGDLLGEVYNEFANESSINGIKYTSKERSIPERIFWLIIIILSVAAAGILAQKFYYRHKQANMRTLVISNQYPSWKTPLPALTICHPIIASRDRLNKYEREVQKFELPYGITSYQFYKDLQYLHEALNPTNHFQEAVDRLNIILGRNNMTIREFFEITSPTCEDFIVLCRYEGEILPCSHLIKQSLSPHGLCCSINYAYIDGERRWTEQEEYYSSHYGQNFILSFLIRSYTLSERISSSIYGDGIKVLIHDRYTYPGFSAKEFVAGQGYEIIAYLHGQILTASEEVLKLSDKERDCYVRGVNGDIYRADNCFAECQERTYKYYCNCVPFYASIVEENDTVCNFTHISCLARVKASVLELTRWGPPCNCLPGCEGIGFNVVTTVVPMLAAQFNPSAFYQTARMYPNATAIHVTFAGQTVMLQRRDLVLSWINLVSSLGGVFSLFLGCSFISVLEIIYFIGCYASRLIKNNKRDNLSQTT